MQRNRVAAIRFSGTEGGGTGYLIADRYVLTARHVVGNKIEPPEPGAVRLISLLAWGNAAVWREAEIVSISESLDLALLRFRAVAQQLGTSDVEPVRWGRLGDARMPYETIGFPGALDQAPRRWVDHQATWNIEPRSGRWREGLIQLKLADHSSFPVRPEGWRGYSGAALFIGDWLCGVIATVPSQFHGILWVLPVQTIAADPAFRGQLELATSRSFELEEIPRDYIEQCAIARTLDASAACYLRLLETEFSRIGLFPAESISIDDIIDLPLISESTRGEPHIAQSSTVLDPASPYQRILIIGPRGGGKTTLLRSLTVRLARHCQESDSVPAGKLQLTSLPIYLDLTGFSGDLVQDLRNILTSRHIGFDEQHFIIYLRHGRPTFLLDGFERVANRNRFIFSLSNLIQASPQARFVVSTSDTGSLDTEPFTSFLRYGVEPLSRDQIRQILALHVPQGTAGDLVEQLTNAGQLEFFRTPLMAWFFAQEWRAARGPRPSSLAKRGQLYGEVLKSLLERLEPAGSAESRATRIAIKTRALHAVAYKSLNKPTDQLSVRDAQAAIREPADAWHFTGATSKRDLLSVLLSDGFLHRSGGTVVFAHSTFLHYFAGAALCNEWTLPRLILTCLSRRWQEALPYAIGILDVPRQRRLLSIHLGLVRIWFCIDLLPFRVVEYIFAALRCLGDCHEDLTESKRRFVRLLLRRKGSLMFLRHNPKSLETARFGGSGEDVIASFCLLLGRLRIPEARIYLKRERRRYAIFGLAQGYDEEALRDLLAGFAEPYDGDGIADMEAGALIARMPDHVLRCEIPVFLAREAPDVQARVLSAVSWAAERGDGTNDRLRVNRDFWLPLLLPLALHPEKELSNQALSVIRKFTNPSGYLPAEAEDFLIETIHREDGVRRARAVWALVYGKRGVPEVSSVLGSDDDDNVIASALDYLSVHDRENLPTHACTVVRRRPHFRDTIENLIPGVQAQLELEDIETATLVVALLSAKEGWIRVVCAMALALTGERKAVPIMTMAYRLDGDSSVRRHALRGLITLLGDDAEPLIVEGLNDPDPSVRHEALSSFWRLDKEAGRRALPQLSTIARDDPDQEVRVEAGALCKRLG
jgi:hypothetical protein